jgi:ABC-type enterobactin transport system permease subunit
LTAKTFCLKCLNIYLISYNNPTTTPSSAQPARQTGSLLGLDWEKTAVISMAVIIAGLVATVVMLCRKLSAKQFFSALFSEPKIN